VIGIEWVNIITGKDHTVRDVGAPYFCEIHLAIELESEYAFDNLNNILNAPAEAGPAIDAKQRQVQAILQGELKRKGRDNVSTLAIVDAIRLR
jgi:hypothetical protein